jgi:transcriptional regulator with XRE-family HTH domain
VTAIRRLREERGFSQQELAQALGVTQGAVSHWENGVRKPDIDDIVKIAQLFNCKLDDLIEK